MTRATPPGEPAPRVLVVAYAYPPCGGAGVQRTTKTVAHLARLGWPVSVLTVDPSSYGIHDNSIRSDAGVDILRTRCVDPMARYLRPSPVDNATRSSTAGATRQGGSARRMAKWAWQAAERHLLVPDRFVLWYPSAVRAAVQMQARGPFDVVYTTGEPYSAFLIASRIARRVRVPVVLDMRDPWTVLPYRTEAHGRWRGALERRMEARVLKGCAACIFANRASEAYAARYPSLRHKFHYVPNGFDPADFADVRPLVFDKYTIVHNGTFLPGYRTADTALLALRRLIDDVPSMRGQVQVLFVGKAGDERQVAERLGLHDVVSHVGYRPHAESLGYVCGADALLLVGGTRAWEETGKVYEYLAAGKPILALVEPAGAAADLLRRCPSIARVVSRESVDGTAAALRELVTRGRTARVVPPAWLADYERGRLAERTASILRSVVSASAREPRQVVSPAEASCPPPHRVDART